MDFEKIKQWMEISRNYQNGKFWDMIFDQSSLEQMMKNGDEPLVGKKPEQGSLKDFPKTDIFLTDTAVILLLELPGARKEDVSLSVSGIKLSIKGNLTLPNINGVTVHSERKYGEFQRVIELPEPTDSKDIHARFENGLLVITYSRKYSQEERIIIK